MKTISIYKIGFKKPRSFKILCTDSKGTQYSHVLVFCSLAEFSAAITTLQVYGFIISNVLLENPYKHNIYNFSVSLY